MTLLLLLQCSVVFGPSAASVSCPLLPRLDPSRRCTRGTCVDEGDRLSAPETILCISEEDVQFEYLARDKVKAAGQAKGTAEPAHKHVATSVVKAQYLFDPVIKVGPYSRQ